MRLCPSWRPAPAAALLLLLLFGLGWALPRFTRALSFQEGTAPAGEGESRTDRRRVQEKYRSLLERNPYHDVALNKTLQLAAEDNRLDDLVAEFEALAEENPDDAGYRYILGRIYQRSQRLLEAVAQLESSPERNDRILGLLGEIQAQRGDYTAAARTLEEAAEQANSEKSLRRLYRQIGDLHLAREQREEAAAAYRRILQIDPRSYFLRLEVAQALAEGGLYEEAMADYQALLDQVDDDAAKKCSVLRAMGILHEKRKAPAEALGLYRIAADLLGRGNWMKADLEGRIIAVHRSLGTLDDLEGDTRRRMEAEPSNLEHHLFLATVLEESGKAEEAIAVLRTASERFPQDLPLGRRLVDALGVAGDVEGQVRAVQRMIRAHPNEIDLYVDLGRIFASEAKFAQAKLQWEQVLEKQVRDAGLCLRLAELYGQYDLVDDAIHAYEQAIAIEPEEKSHPIALGQYLYSIGRHDEAKERWLATRGRDAEADRTVAEILAGHGFARDALAVASDLLESAPPTASLHLLLAEIHADLKDEESAKDHARRAAAIAKGGPERDEAIMKLVSLHEASGTEEALIAAEEKATGEGDGVLPALILGELFTRRRESARAIEIYRSILKERVPSPEVVERLARLYRQAGDLPRALETYEKLLALRPGKERPVLREIAEIHLRRDEREEAFDTWRRMIRSQPENPAVFKEVAEAYRDLGMLDEAIQHFRLALEKNPAEPVPIRLDLAEVLAQKRDEEAGIAELRLALGEAKKDDVRDDVRKRLFEMHLARGTLTDATAELEATIDDNPYDVEATLLLADFHMRSYEYALALEMIDKAIPFQRGNARLVLTKARLHAEMDDYEAAVAAFEEAGRTKDPIREVVNEELGEMLAKIGEKDGAARAWARLSDKEREATLLRKHGLEEEALDRLATLLARSPGNVDLLMQKAKVLRAMGKDEEAIAAYTAALEVEPYHRRALTDLGKLYASLNRTEEAVECGRRLLGAKQEENDEKREEEEEDRSYRYYGYSYYPYYWSRGYRRRVSNLAAASEYFSQINLVKELAGVLGEEIEQSPNNLPCLLLLSRFYESELGEPEKALEIYRRMLPVEWDPDEFTHAMRSTTYGGTATYTRAVEPEKEIWTRLQAIYARKADLRLARLEELEKQTERTPEETLELGVLYAQSGQLEEGRETLAEGVEAHPEDARFLALLGQRADSEEEYDESVRLYGRLLEWVRTHAEDVPAKEEEKRRRRTRQSIPYYIRDDATKAQVEEVVELSSTFGRRSRAVNLWIPSEQALLWRIARAHFQLGQDDRAKGLIDEILAMGEDFANLSYVGSLCFENDRYDEAESFYLRSQEDFRRRLENPVFKWMYRGYVNDLGGTAARNLGLIEKKRGNLLEAYELLREGNFTADSKQMLKKDDNGEKLKERYLSTFEETRAALNGAGGPPDPEGGETTDKANEEGEERLRDFLKEAVKLAEIHEGLGETEEAIAVYRQAIAVSPPNIALPLWEAAEAIFERERRLDEAIEAQREMIALKKEMNRNIAKYREKEGLPLQIVRPQSAPTSSFRYSRQGYGGRSGQSGYATTFQTRENYFALAELQIRNGDPGAAVRALMKHFRENPGSGYWSWEIREFADAHKLDKEVLPLYRLMGLEKSKSSYDKLAFAQALDKAGEMKEAIEQYEQIVRDFPSNDWSVQVAQARLQALYDAEGRGEGALADIVAEVQKNPKNAKKRLQLARLYDAQEMRLEAEEQLAVLREEAPYMAEVWELSRKVRLAMGDRQGAIEDLRREIDLRKQPEERTGLREVLGNLLEREGRTEEAMEAWRGMVSPQDPDSYMYLAKLFQDIGEEDAAREAIRKGMEIGAQRQWGGGEIVDRAIGLALLDADVEEIVRLIDEKEKNPYGSMRYYTGEEGPSVFARTRERAHLIEAIRKRAQEKGEDPKAWLLLVEALEADLDHGAATAALEAALERMPQSQEILEEIVEHYEAMGALEKAIRHAETWITTLPADASGLGMPPPGMPRVFYRGMNRQEALPGRQQGYRVLARLQRKAGLDEEAKATIRKIEKEQDKDTYHRMATVFAENEYWPEAIEMHERYFHEAGSRPPAQLKEYAGCLRESGNIARALEVMEEALELEGEEWNRMETLQAMDEMYGRVHDRDLFVRTLEPMVEGQEKKFALRYFLARAYADLDRTEEAVKIYEGLTAAFPSRIEPLDALVNLYTRKKEWANAAAALDRLCALFPEQKSQRAPQLGDLHLKAGDPDKAVAIWEEHLKDPTQPYSYQNLGQIYVQHKMYDKAKEAYEEAARLTLPGWDRSWIKSSMADVYLRLGRHVDAAKATIEAIEVQEGTWSLFYQGAGLRRLFLMEDVRAAAGELRGKDPAVLGKDEARLLGFADLCAGRHEEARRIFRARLEADPSDGAAARGLYLVAFETGTLEEREAAVDAWMECELRGKGRISGLLSEQGEFAVRRGDVERAVALWRRAKSLEDIPIFEPSSRNYYGGYTRGPNLVYQLMNHGKLDLALEELDRALSLGELHLSQALPVAAALRRRAGDPEGARALEVETAIRTGDLSEPLRFSLQDPATAERLEKEIRAQLEHRPRSARLLGLLSEIHHEREQPEEAAEVYRAAFEADPTDTSIAEPYAIRLAQAGKIEEAIPILQDIRKRGAGAGSRYSMGYGYYPGMAYFGGWWPWQGQSPGAKVHLIACYRLGGRTAEAEALERRLLPDYRWGRHTLYSQLSDIFAALDRHGEAAEATRHAIEQAREEIDDEDQLRGTVLNYRANLMHQLKEAGMADEAAEVAREAIAEAEEALEESPWGQEWMITSIANWHSRYTGDHEAAVRTIDDAVALFPNRPDFWQSKTWIHIRAGQGAEALAAIDRTLELIDRFGYASGHEEDLCRALAHRLLGDWAGAKSSLAEAEEKMGAPLDQFADGEFEEAIREIRARQ